MNIVHLEDARWDLDAVLNGRVEGVNHGWGSVPLPVCFVHLHNKYLDNRVHYFHYYYFYLLPEFAPGVVGAPHRHVDTIKEVRLIAYTELQESVDKKICLAKTAKRRNLPSHKVPLGWTPARSPRDIFGIFWLKNYY